MPRKDERRSQIDDLKTAYHVVNAVRQVSWLRREWDDIKSTIFDFLIFGTAAGIALILGFCSK
jgi:hypothetical protein